MFRRFLSSLVALALLLAPLAGAAAQTYATNNPTYIPTVTLPNTTIASTAAPATLVWVVNNTVDVLLSVSGTFSGLTATVSLSANRQNTAIWTGTSAQPIGAGGLLKTITAVGLYRIKAGGAAQIQINVTALSSGSVVLAMSGDGAQSLVDTAPLLRNTYSSTINVASPAASATDLIVLPGNATTTVRVNRIACIGTATANGVVTLSLIKRSAANTGTSSAGTVVPLDSLAPAALSTPISYAANPTTGAAVGTVRASVLSLPDATTTTIESTPIVWTFGDRNEQAIALRGVAQSLAINAGGVSFPSGGTLTCDLTWTEE